jgi:hypothetical protein
VRLVEDVHLAAQVAGRIGQPVAQVADLVDARIRANEVLPVPRGPTNRTACDTRSVRTAFRSVSTTASWPTIWLNVWARQRR